jgi:hypothetical protein
MALMDGIGSAGLHRHRGRSWRMHAAPIQTFKQSGELGGRQVNDAVLHLGPAELTILQSLVPHIGMQPRPSQIGS